MTLTSEQQFIVDVVDRVCTGAFSRKQAQQVLDISQSTLERYLRQYRSLGPRFALHGNAGKTPHNQTSVEIKAQVKWLMESRYFDFNLTHALEKLKLEHSIVIKREVFRLWCHEWGMVKRAKRRRSSAKARYKRDRMPKEGLMLQMDGSPHRWFGEKESCLIATIDDATSRIPYAEFFRSEDTLSCLKVLRSIIERFGVFEILYVDRAGIFGGHKRQNFSQVKRALGELGIQVIFAQSPEAKGRVERLFQTLQDRLIPEMRLRHIGEFETANHFLQEQFIPNAWEQTFTLSARDPEPAYRAVSQAIDLNEIFCVKEHRQVGRDHTLSWNGVKYLLKSPIKYSIAKQKIEIRTYPDLSWKAFYANKPIDLTPLPAHQQPSPKALNLCA